ncbi:MAG: Nuclear protein SET [Microgenomates group bacterium GW2011_GWA1_48_10]|nr:MAG: Nuclear protein SET [Microgenomates group bacterium GW2011_GWA1_48_10]
MSLLTWVSPKAVKGKTSKIEGKGLFALQKISKDEIVAVKGGHIVDRRAMDEIWKWNEDSELQIADDLYITPLEKSEIGGSMMYLNHSCEPNVGLAGNIIFVAMRDIDSGEELTIDYAMIDGDEDDAMECRCGSRNCRKTIRGTDWKRKDLQEKYKGYFSWFLEQRIKDSRV